MFGRSKRASIYSMASFKAPVIAQQKKIIDVVPTISPSVERPEERAEVTKIDKAEKIVELQKEDKKVIAKENQNNKILKISNFESVKQEFLQVKNKSLYIKKNKKMIKSLKDSEQKEFILLAKEHL